MNISIWGIAFYVLLVVIPVMTVLGALWLSKHSVKGDFTLTSVLLTFGFAAIVGFIAITQPANLSAVTKAMLVAVLLFAPIPILWDILENVGYLRKQRLSE